MEVEEVEEVGSRAWHALRATPMRLDSWFGACLEAARRNDVETLETALPQFCNLSDAFYVETGKRPRASIKTYDDPPPVRGDIEDISAREDVLDAAVLVAAAANAPNALDCIRKFGDHIRVPVQSYTLDDAFLEAVKKGCTDVVTQLWTTWTISEQLYRCAVRSAIACGQEGVVTFLLAPERFRDAAQVTRPRKEEGEGEEERDARTGVSPRLGALWLLFNVLRRTHVKQALWGHNEAEGAAIVEERVRVCLRWGDEAERALARGLDLLMIALRIKGQVGHHMVESLKGILPDLFKGASDVSRRARKWMGEARGGGGGGTG